MPEVSIIMGIYNCEKTLADTIDSVLNQTYKNWELIICDDFSNDKTYSIAKKYTKEHDNIILLKNDRNMGLAYSLNKCLQYAKGKYIARLDGDDICLSERLQIQVDFLNNHPEFHVVGSSAILYDESGDKNIRKMKEIPNKSDLVKSVPHIHPSIMMRRECYKKLGGYTVSKRTRRGQDADLWFRFYANGFRGYNIQKPLVKYHESIADYKKRDLKTRLYGMQTRLIGFKALRLPIWKYIYIIKPIIAFLIPNKIMYYYHKKE